MKNSTAKPPIEDGSTSVRCEVAAAFRRIAAEWRRLPDEAKDRLEPDWDGAHKLLDRDLLDGDRATAIAAIRSWENSHFDVFEKAAME